MNSISKEELAELPYVQFERAPVEDREASYKQGHFVCKDVDMVNIVPRGSKDKVVKEVAEWFESLRQLVAQQRMNPAVLDSYKDSYERWKKGEEIPEEGTPIKTWPVASPAQVKTLIGIGIFTVERLAGANEETITRLGMAGRALVTRAQAYLKDSQDKGIPAMKLEGLTSELHTANLRIKALTEQVDGLKAKLALASAPAAK